MERMTQNTADSRFAKIKIKLREDELKQRESLQSKHGMTNNSSRENVWPGKTEAQDEVRRSHLLIGKLREKKSTQKRYFGRQGNNSELASQLLSMSSAKTNQIQRLPRKTPGPIPIAEQAPSDDVSQRS